MNKRMLSVEELSQEFNLKESWIRSAVFKKTIPFIKLSKLIRFDKEVIEDWLLSNTVSPKERLEV